MTKDLTSGNPFKIILLFTLPLMLGNLFQQFYSLADTIIVGRFVGVNALAAVGATGSVNYQQEKPHTRRCTACLGRGRRIRTLGTRFWRPLLYQLSYAPM